MQGDSFKKILKFFDKPNVLELQSSPTYQRNIERYTTDTI